MVLMAMLLGIPCALLGNYLLLRGREAIEHPGGTRAMETYWFGYLCVPQHAKHTEPRAYPFTERRQEWIVDWVTKTYAAGAMKRSASARGTETGSPGRLPSGKVPRSDFSTAPRRRQGPPTRVP
jgi:hypothetical protein